MYTYMLVLKSCIADLITLICLEWYDLWLLIQTAYIVHSRLGIKENFDVMKYLFISVQIILINYSRFYLLIT